MYGHNLDTLPFKMHIYFVECWDCKYDEKKNQNKRFYLFIHLPGRALGVFLCAWAPQKFQSLLHKSSQKIPENFLFTTSSPNLYFYRLPYLIHIVKIESCELQS